MAKKLTDEEIEKIIRDNNGPGFWGSLLAILTSMLNLVLIICLYIIVLGLVVLAAGLVIKGLFWLF